MNWILLLLCGVFGGVLGGMGMGGGTLLIPLLSILFGLEQHCIQAINLISFIPMSIVALIIHLKNKLIEFKYIFYVIIPGVVMSIAGCFLAKNLSGGVLQKCFGGFLIALSICYLINYFKRKRK